MKKQSKIENVMQFDTLRAADVYEAPVTWRNRVETEGGICESAPAQVEINNQTIEVEEWATVGNDVTFE